MSTVTESVEVAVPVSTAYVIVGVIFGIITAVLFLVPVLVAGVRCLKRTAGPASVALAGQIPVLLVTSPITQWQLLLFFMMGAVAAEVTSRSATVSEQADEKDPVLV